MRLTKFDKKLDKIVRHFQTRPPYFLFKLIMTIFDHLFITIFSTLLKILLTFSTFYKGLSWMYYPAVICLF